METRTVWTEDYVKDLHKDVGFFTVSDFYPKGFVNRVLEYRDLLEPIDFVRHYSLFNVKTYLTWCDEEFMEYLNGVLAPKNLISRSNNILEYGVGSFAQLHADNNNPITFITLLEKEEGTQGGENIFMRNHKDRFAEDEKVSRREEDRIKGIILKQNKPTVLSLENVGDTLVMANGMLTRHAVAEITKGKRTVFINWMHVKE